MRQTKDWVKKHSNSDTGTMRVGFKKKKKDRDKLKEVGPDVEREREKSEGTRTSTVSTSMELADQPDLAPAGDKGQWQERAEQRSEGGWVGWEVRTWDVGFRTSQACCFRVYHKINGIGKSICQNLWFPSSSFSLLACRSCVGEAKKKEKRKKRHRTLESGKPYLFRCLTRVRAT